MAKFHINPSTGNPGRCNAARACPFGGAEEHFDSMEEARTFFELEMGGDQFSSTLSKSSSSEAAKDIQAKVKLIEREAFTKAVDSREQALDKAYTELPPLTPPERLSAFDRTTYVEERQKGLAKVISGHMDLYRKEFSASDDAPYSEERSKKRREKIAELMLESIEQERSLIPKSSFLNRKEVAERHAKLDKQVASIHSKLSV